MAAGKQKKRKATEDPAPTTVKKPKVPKSIRTNGSKEIKTSGKSEKPEDTRSSTNQEVLRSVSTSKKKIRDVKISSELNLPREDGAGAEAGGYSDEGEESSSSDDQTEALLKGLESDGDEDDFMHEGGLQPGQDIPAVPTVSKKLKLKMKQAEAHSELEKPGVVYIGRIPHGFYEEEMKAYFTQFGKILKLRMSRNRQTGASRHRAWIQFETATVADIVAKTMDNYLLFGHILKVKLVPDEQIPANLFKGANRRFKKVPWTRIQGRKLEQGASEATWEGRIEKEKTKRSSRAEKLKQIGYDFDAPELKSTKVLGKDCAVLPALTAGEEVASDDRLGEIEPAEDIEEASNTTKKHVPTSSPELVEAPKKKKRKEKKSKPMA